MAGKRDPSTVADAHRLYAALRSVLAAGSEPSTRAGLVAIAVDGGEEEHFSDGTQVDAPRVELAGALLVESGLVRSGRDGLSLNPEVEVNELVGSIIRGSRRNPRSRPALSRTEHPVGPDPETAGPAAASRPTRRRSQSLGAGKKASPRRPSARPGPATTPGGSPTSTSAPARGRTTADTSGRRSRPGGRAPAGSERPGIEPAVPVSLADLLEQIGAQVAAISTLSRRIDSTAAALDAMRTEHAERMAVLISLRGPMTSDGLRAALDTPLVPDLPQYADR